MEAKYIVAIIVLGIFFLLIFVSFAVLEYERIRAAKLQSWIGDQYDSKEVKKYDYDADDEDLVPSQETQVNTDDVEDSVEEAADMPAEETYGKIDVEGIEEITGTYKGDK